MTPVVRTEELVKRYGRLTAVDGVSLAVEPGEVFALLGPNGAGKTTTVEILEGFRRPDAGRVEVLGEDPAAARRRLAHRVGVMPQQDGFYPGIRPGEALRLFASFYDGPQDPARLLEEVGLAGVARTPYRRLSGGERRRLSLALALVGGPDVAFLDEPTAGMDVRARTRTWEIVSALRSRGTTVVLTTHLLEEAERLADRVAIMHRGRLVAAGSPAELVGEGRALRFRAPQGVDTAGLSADLGEPVTEELPGSYEVKAPATPALIARLTSRLADRDVLLRELVVGRRSLEEVFLELTEEEPR